MADDTQPDSSLKNQTAPRYENNSTSLDITPQNRLASCAIYQNFTRRRNCTPDKYSRSTSGKQHRINNYGAKTQPRKYPQECIDDAKENKKLTRNDTPRQKKSARKNGRTNRKTPQKRKNATLTPRNNTHILTGNSPIVEQYHA